MKDQTFEQKMTAARLPGASGHYSSFQCWTCKQHKNPLGRKKDKRTGFYKCAECVGAK